MRFRSTNLLLWPAVLAPVALPRDYYVAPTGSDGSPGTLALPFQTIQKAASTAVAGDTVFVRAGIFRETDPVSKQETGDAKLDKGGMR